MLPPIAFARVFWFHNARPVLAASVLAALTACGGSDDTDPLQAYREQSVSWERCDPAAYRDAGEKAYVESANEVLGDRLQCATVKAPMDWSDPSQGDVHIAVNRLLSAQPAERQGALFFNPGGPGASGLLVALSTYRIMSKGDPATEQGALQLKLADRYDWVGFDPRGVGQSTAYECQTRTQGSLTTHAPAGVLTAANLALTASDDAATAAACSTLASAPHLHTEATARDLELLRVVMDEPRMNFYGYSYGTWLGGWYASLFPDTVGRMVLDSAMDYTGTFEDNVVHSARARQRVHSQVLLPYAARHHSTFGLGASAQGIQDLFDGLLPPIQDVVLSHFNGTINSSSHANNYITALALGRLLDAAVKSVAPFTDPAHVIPALQAEAERTKTTALLPGAYTLYDAVQKRWDAPRPALGADTNLAVRCNDTPATPSLERWQDHLHTLQAAIPLFIGNVVSNACLYWPRSAIHKPSMAPLASLDILMVQAQYDALTALEGADLYLEKLPAAKQVYVTGEYSHGLFPYNRATDPTPGGACVDLAVIRYLLGESPRTRQTACEGYPLAHDRAAAKSAATAQQSPYRDAEQVQEMIDRLKDSLGAAKSSVL
jgi:pimeloyl-ACP methyl ester carboxylesterase